MKRLFLIGGTMGIGKSTVSQILKRQLPNSVFLDGDWCWDSSPFQVTAETKEMVIQNICAVLNNFLKCSAYENVIFCWVMHEQSIIDQIVYFVSKSDTVDTYFEDSLDFEYKLSLLQQYDAVIINPDSLYVAEEKNKQAMDTYVQKGGTLIPFQYLIDNGSLIYIEERISQLFEQKLV